VEPHNHHVNAAERVIQTFKDAFIAALATTDRDFPLQLWDWLAPQIQDTLNLLRASQIFPNISAYEALNGPYNWDQYPLAPPGCKAIIYKAPVVHRSVLQEHDPTRGQRCYSSIFDLLITYELQTSCFS
jgi:hypothetical protein